MKRKIKKIISICLCFIIIAFPVVNVFSENTEKKIYDKWSKEYNYTLNNKEKFTRSYKFRGIFWSTVGFLAGYRMATMEDPEGHGISPNSGCVLMAYCFYKGISTYLMDKKSIEKKYQKKLNILEKRGKSLGHSENK